MFKRKYVWDIDRLNLYAVYMSVDNSNCRLSVYESNLLHIRGLTVHKHNVLAVAGVTVRSIQV
jgi:hypothetical protein